MRPMRTPIDQIGRRASGSQLDIRPKSTIQKYSSHRTEREEYEYERKCYTDYIQRNNAQAALSDEEKRIQENKIQQEVYEIIYFRPISDWAYNDDLRINKEVEKIMDD